jgi:Bifunctional DNA primase/polymerase, N-terminal/AAA domain
VSAEPALEANPGEWALAYAALGWRALPITPGKKWPPMQSWPHVASTDPDKIRNWFKGLYRGFGVGIATGEGSGIFALDVDTYNEGGDTLHDLERQHGPLPVTVEAVTGGGGRHLIFCHPGKRVMTVKSFLPGLDVRGDGGQIVVAPTVHPNGNRYAWHVDLSPWDVPVAEAPDWLIQLVTERPPEPEPEPVKPPADVDDSDSIAKWVNDSHDWAAVLAGDGWTPGRPTSDQQFWTRPGKEPRDGHSAALHLPDGPFVVFSTDASLSPLMQPWAKTRTGDGWAYSMFGYLTATRFNGDRSECARQYRRQRNEDEMRAWTGVTAPVVAAALGGTVDDSDRSDPTMFANLVDWSQLFAGVHGVEEWVAWPFVPKGRATALFAPAKAGKSTIVLAVVAAVATGRRVLGVQDCDPANVLYLDYEMTEGDLLERLEELGYSADDDLSRLHYALLPSLPPLDTREGAKAVLELARHVHAELVVVDTLGRAVEGDENEADTIRAFYRHTGLALKSAGIGVLRTDHAGKDVSKGQRGSSAKNDDVDVVWKLTRADDGLRLERTHSRLSWGPRVLSVSRTENEDGVVEFTTAEQVHPTGTFHAVEHLDNLGVDPSASGRAAIRALREAGFTASNEAARAAQKHRRTLWISDQKARREADGAPSAPTAPCDSTARHGAVAKDQVDATAHPHGAPRRTPASPAPPAPLYKSGAVADQGSGDDLESPPKATGDDLFA